MELPSALLGPSSKNKKHPSPKKFLLFKETKHSSPIIKRFVIFLSFQPKLEKFFKKPTPKKLLILWENGTF